MPEPDLTRRNALTKRLHAELDKEAFQRFCAAVGQKYDDLAGESLPNKMMEMVLLWERRERLGELEAMYAGWRDQDRPGQDRPGSNQPPADVLPAPELFIGRDKELADLLAELRPGHVAAICGPGGMGKTTLMQAAVAALPPDRFPEGVVIHTFYNEKAVGYVYEKLIARFGGNRQDGEAEARRILGSKRLLLVLDGAEAAEGDLAGLRRMCRAAGCLVTSRRREDAERKVVVLGRLAEEDGVALLQEWATGAERNRAADMDAARGIVAAVGGVPLALRLVGRYLGLYEVEAAEYLAMWRETPLEALVRVAEGEHQYENMWKVLYHQTLRLSDGAARLLHVCSWLALAPFPAEWLTVATDWLDEGATQGYLAELVNHCLLMRGEKAYQVAHALIHTYAQRLTPLEGAADGKRLAGYLAGFAESHADKGMAGYGVLNPVRGHLVGCVAACVQQRAFAEANRLVWAVHEYFYMQGFMLDLVQVLGEGLTAARALRREGQDKRHDELAHLNHLGNACRTLGQVEKAIGYYEEALAIADEMGDLPNKGNCLSGLGIAYCNLGEIEKGIEYLEKGLVIVREIGDRQGEGNRLGNLGNAYRILGQVEKAIEYYEEALTIACEIGDRRGEGTRLGNLGIIYKDLGWIEKAIGCYEKGLTIACEVGNRYGEGVCLGNLGNIYAELGQVEEAIGYHEQALVIAREIGDRYGEGIYAWNLGLGYETSDSARAVALMSIRVAYEEEIGHPDAANHRAQVAAIQNPRPPSVWQRLAAWFRRLRRKSS